MRGRELAIARIRELNCDRFSAEDLIRRHGEARSVIKGLASMNSNGEIKLDYRTRKGGWLSVYKFVHINPPRAQDTRTVSEKRSAAWKALAGIKGRFTSYEANVNGATLRSLHAKGYIRPVGMLDWSGKRVPYIPGRGGLVIWEKVK